MKLDRRLPLLCEPLFAAATRVPAHAHHSSAMYDRSRTCVFTGVVVSVNPDPSRHDPAEQDVPLGGFK